MSAFPSHLPVGAWTLSSLICMNMCITGEVSWIPIFFPNHLEFFSSVQFSRSVVSDSLRPHESQHARPPCPSPTPEFTKTHVHWVDDAIQPSHPLSSPLPHAPNPSQHQSLPMSQLFAWGGQSTGVSALASFLLHLIILMLKLSQIWPMGTSSKWPLYPYHRPPSFWGKHFLTF